MKNLSFNKLITDNRLSNILSNTSIENLIESIIKELENK